MTVGRNINKAGCPNNALCFTSPATPSAHAFFVLQKIMSTYLPVQHQHFRFLVFIAAPYSGKIDFAVAAVLSTWSIKQCSVFKNRVLFLPFSIVFPSSQEKNVRRIFTGHDMIRRRRGWWFTSPPVRCTSGVPDRVCPSLPKPDSGQGAAAPRCWRCFCR